MRKASTVLIATAMGLSMPMFATAGSHAIEADDVLAAQEGWCEALVDISQTYEDEGQEAAEKLAGDVIDEAYGYQLGDVLFKPTMTVNPQTFRTSREGALSYFVAGNSDYPDDSGFALNNWTECESENAAMFIADRTASTMGKVHFTNADGEVTTVDKTWKFYNDDDGDLRIVVHHSSLEYEGE